MTTRRTPATSTTQEPPRSQSASMRRSRWVPAIAERRKGFHGRTPGAGHDLTGRFTVAHQQFPSQRLGAGLHRETEMRGAVATSGAGVPAGSRYRDGHTSSHVLTLPLSATLVLPFPMGCQGVLQCTQVPRNGTLSGMSGCSEGQHFEDLATTAALGP